MINLIYGQRLSKRNCNEDLCKDPFDSNFLLEILLMDENAKGIAFSNAYN